MTYAVDDYGLKKYSTDFGKIQLRIYFNKRKLEMIDGLYRSIIGYYIYY